MALFTSRAYRALGEKYRRVRVNEERLYEENMALHCKLYDVYGRERLEYLAKELELTPTQKSKLEWIFSVERAKLSGAQLDKILKTREEAIKFFLGEEP